MIHDVVLQDCVMDQKMQIPLLVSFPPNLVQLFGAQHLMLSVPMHLQEVHFPEDIHRQHQHHFMFVVAQAIAVNCVFVCGEVGLIMCK